MNLREDNTMEKQQDQIMLEDEDEVREAFWNDHPNAERRPGRQNNQAADTRMAFVDYVEMLARSGIISEALAQKVTL